MQKLITIGLILICFSLFWWSALVLGSQGEYKTIPTESIILAGGGILIMLYATLSWRRGRDPIERYYWNKEDL